MIKTVDDHMAAVALAVDELDLEPVVFTLTQPGPGLPGMPAADAGRLAVLYRCYLTLCALYPGEQLVPPGSVDEVWRAHISGTGKYAADCQQVFGCFLHRFPCPGLRDDDEAWAWHAAYARTCELFREHFGMSLTAEASASCNATAAAAPAPVPAAAAACAARAVAASPSRARPAANGRGLAAPLITAGPR